MNGKEDSDGSSIFGTPATASCLDDVLKTIRNDRSFQVTSLTMRQVLLLETMVGNYLCGVSDRRKSGGLVCCNTIGCIEHTHRQKLMVHRRLPLELLYIQSRLGRDCDVLESLRRYVTLRDSSVDRTGFDYPLSCDVVGIHEEGALLLGQNCTTGASQLRSHTSLFEVAADPLAGPNYDMLLRIRRTKPKLSTRPFNRAYKHKLSRLTATAPGEVLSYLRLKLQPYQSNDRMRTRELEQRYGAEGS